MSAGGDSPETERLNGDNPADHGPMFAGEAGPGILFGYFEFGEDCLGPCRDSENFGRWLAFCLECGSGIAKSDSVWRFRGIFVWAGCA